MTNKHISGFIYMVLNQGIMYLRCLYLRNYCTVQCTWVHVYVHIKKLCLRAAVVANQSLTASMSDRWICSIIRYSRRFSSIVAVIAVYVQCECCKSNTGKLFLPYNFFLEGIGVGHPWLRLCNHIHLVTWELYSHIIFEYYYYYRVLRAICCQPVDGSLICFM